MSVNEKPVSEWKGVCDKCGRTSPREHLVVRDMGCGEARELNEFAREQFQTYWLGAAAWAPNGRLVAYTTKPDFTPSIKVVTATPARLAAEQMLEALDRLIFADQNDLSERTKAIDFACEALSKARGSWKADGK